MHSHQVQYNLQLRPFERVALVLFGLGVIFASLGLGEAVYRILFLQFDGATDRFPLEMLAGIVFAFVATRLFRVLCEHRRARMKLIRDRNDKIRHALQAIVPVSLPGHQQAIRVIREEVDRIDYALCDDLQPEKQPFRELWAIFN
jgi:hypothetical protein